MNKNSLLSSQGSYLIVVDIDVANDCDILDLIRTKKIIRGEYESGLRYDWDGDGDVDEADIEALKRKLLGIGETK